MPLQHLSKAEARKFGIPKNSIQTILFPKDEFTLKQARETLQKNGYLYQNYRLEKNHRRFQQTPPIIGAKYHSKKIQTSDGEITLVFQKY